MKKLFDDDIRPSIEQMRRTARRVTPEEHAQWHSRMGRPPKGEDRCVSMTIRVAPTVMASLKAKAQKLEIKYQTFINQVLTVAAA